MGVLYYGSADPEIRKKESPEHMAKMHEAINVLWPKKKRVILPQSILMCMHTRQLVILHENPDEETGAEYKLLPAIVLTEPRINRSGRFLLTALADPLLKNISLNLMYGPDDRAIFNEYIQILGREALEELYKRHLFNNMNSRFVSSLNEIRF